MDGEQDDFCQRVDNFLDKEFMGSIIWRNYGISKSRHRFVFVVSTVLWYAVRLVMETSDGNIRLVERKEFLFPSNAYEYIFDKQRELEGIYCWNESPISLSFGCGIDWS